MRSAAEADILVFDRGGDRVCNLYDCVNLYDHYDDKPAVGYIPARVPPMNLELENVTSFEARISPDVLFRELDGEAVLLDLKSQRYFGLDEVGTRIWHWLSERGRTDAVLHAMTDEFEVDEARLRQDLTDFVGELADAGLIELGQPTAG